MIIVFTPADGDEERYDVRSLLTSEASIVGRTIDRKWSEVRAGIQEDDPDSLRAVVWVLKKRAASTLRFKDFDPGVDELVSRWDDREVDDHLTEAAKVTDAPDEDRHQFSRMLIRNSADPARTEALIKDAAAEPGPDAPAPKEVAKSSPTSKKPA